MSTLTDTAPKRIWLCVSDDVDDNDTPYPELYAEDAEITWSTDQPVAVTVEYVRVDLSEIAKLRAERDALAAARIAYATEFPINDDGEPDVENVHANIRALKVDRDALAEDVEQLRVQLACCGVIAGSNTEDSLARAMPGKDAYGYSASLADVERCVRREIALRTERDALREEVSLRRHTMPAEYAKLLAQRDYAMEMVNVQDGQIDALRALLKVARDCIYSLDAREIYADELALIDAALAEGRS